MHHAKLVIRPVRADDERLLVEGFARLSPEARYMRFFAAKPSLSADEVRFLTQPDGVSHFAVGAAIERGGVMRGLGVARWVRQRAEDHIAHVAITIVDDARRLGLATRLLRALGHAALVRSVETFRFTVLPSNVPMRSFLARHRVPMIVEEGLLVADWPVECAARVRASDKWRALLAG
jgi:ribosomal protein S18 acetylase RimI-like enzyme